MKLTLFVVVVVMFFVLTIGVASAVSVSGAVVIIPVAAVPQRGLTVVALPVLYVAVPIDVVAHPGGRFIDHHLVSPVEVIVPAPLRQRGAIYPGAAVEINKLLSGHTIIDVDVGHIIIIDVLVALGPPLRL